MLLIATDQFRCLRRDEERKENQLRLKERTVSYRKYALRSG